jgi:MerR family Zn(II)-responsive transcriptional regulator of zntA
MDDLRTISQLAKSAGVPTSTIRYYERAGLLRPTSRSRGGNYRLYDDDAFDRLRFIRAAQATGLTLGDVATLLEHHHGSPASCREVRDLIERRLDDVKQRMKDLQLVKRVLTSALDTCQTTEPTDPCKVLDQLRLGPEPRPSARKKRP